MKVLFALNNDNVSNAIIKKYQKQYKEIISYKNVYYFNAILKELQKDKTYDRVVISEDLEPFANNDYDTIDKFIFEKLDKISDEATKQNGEDIDIILICSDRINKADSTLIRFFGLGIYNAIFGNDRQVETVCSLINQPRTKKEAKLIYGIEANSVNYQSESENSVNETEVQNILAHYKRLGKNEDKYVDSFNTIVAQYTDEQLKVIIKCLPLHVRAVLEERSPKYQELATFSKDTNGKIIHNNYKKPNKKEAITSKMIDDESGKTKITGPIVIPNALKSKEIKEIKEKKHNENSANTNYEKTSNDSEDIDLDIMDEDFEEVVEEKRRRGRPRKIVNEEIKIDEQPKRGRGRPRKNNIESEPKQFEETTASLIENIEMPDIKVNNDISVPEVEMDDPIDLFNISDEDQDKVQESTFNTEDEKEVDEPAFDLFSMDEEKEAEDEVEEEQETIDLFNIEDTENDNKVNIEDNTIQNSNEEDSTETFTNDIIQKTNSNIIEDNNTLITKDVKVVCFVGTTKNGTSFLVNNVAEMLSGMGISTAILDMTKSKNAYYIYTKNDEALRNIAIQSTKKLEYGEAKGISVNKKLSVYTSLPDDAFEINDVDTIISTLKSKYAVVLIDCDFDTDIRFFEKSEEIYLVQTQDVLTIQPFTAFLRNLKAKNVLKQEKLKIVINKEQKVKGLNDKILIGGMAYYNDPSMAFMTELFNKDKITYCKIPFDSQNYAKYLSSIVNCSINLNGYTKQFMNALHELSAMVYPLIDKPKYSARGSKKKEKPEIFSNEVNNTLNKMKNSY